MRFLFYLIFFFQQIINKSDALLNWKYFWNQTKCMTLEENFFDRIFYFFLVEKEKK